MVMSRRSALLEKAKVNRRESKYVEFKEKFDIESPGDWCEIIKEIVAMANTDGGVILVGVRNDGTPSGFDVTPVLNLDPAQLTDKVAKYTDVQFSEFEIVEIVRDGHRMAAILVHQVSIPIIFVRPGTYDIGEGKQKTAFGRGTIYFRHGAKSEPGSSNDLRLAMERELERVRKSWFGNIRKVVQAPPGSSVQVLPPPEVRVSTEPTAMPIRVVEEEGAPAYRLETPDSTHPYRQKEVLQIVNERLTDKMINSHDILCVRTIHGIDETKPQYHYKGKFGARQYSEEFVNWLIENHNEDPLFFEKARDKYKELKR
jgi:hypothetical protein